MSQVAAVSFLNARPLIDGLDSLNGLRLSCEVPSRLLQLLLEGRAEVALCPVIDFQTSARSLQVLRAGAIGSAGRTLTVRVFSRAPLAKVKRIHVDGDSHTSVALLQVIYDAVYQHRPEILKLNGSDAGESPLQHPEALLLIGDKVVNFEPDPRTYPHQLDLGQAWRSLTGLPFVFAAWMALEGAELGRVPELLEQQRRRNLRRLDRIVDTHADPAGWPRDLARDYLGRLLCYELGQPQIDAMQLFFHRCHQIGLIDELRPLRLYGEGGVSEK